MFVRKWTKIVQISFLFLLSFRFMVEVIHNWSSCSWHDQQPRMKINQQNERLILPTMITKGWGAIFRYRWTFIHDGDIGKSDWSSGWVYLLFFSSFSPFYSGIWLFNPRPAGIYGNFFFNKIDKVKMRWVMLEILQQHTKTLTKKGNERLQIKKHNLVGLAFDSALA